MSEPRWADVEVGDAIIAEIIGTGDVTVSGTVVEVSGALLGGLYLSGMMYPVLARTWTLLDIIKPEPQLPTTPGSVIRLFDSTGYPFDYMLTGTVVESTPWVNVRYGDRSYPGENLPFVVLYDAGKK